MRTAKILFIAAGLSTGTAIAQNDTMQMNKKQFVALYENALQARKSMPAGGMAEEMMRKNLSPEQFEQWKKEEKMFKQEQNQTLADCAGISVDKLNELEEKMTPEFQLSLMKQCSNKLPELINVGASNLHEAPELAEFSACTESLVSKKFGVSAKKIEACRMEFEGEDYGDEGYDEDQDW